MIAEILAVLFILKISDAVMFNAAQYVEDHTNFTTGPVRLKKAVSSTLWWLA